MSDVYGVAIVGSTPVLTLPVVKRTPLHLFYTKGDNCDQKANILNA